MPKVDPLIASIDKRIRDGEFSVVELCARCKPEPIHQSVVNRWRRGDTAPTLGKLRSFIEALETAEKEKERRLARVA